ncbi:MAG TPA: hypothetical protein VGM77_06065 [Gemmatimonadales bacterium]
MIDSHLQVDRLVAVALLVVLASCRARHETSSRTGPLASSGLPALVSVPLDVAPSDAIDEAVANIAMTSNGTIVYAPANDATPFLRALDSSGHRVAAFGRFGDGPGEWRQPGLFFTVGDTIVVAQPGRPVTMYYDRSGRFLREAPPSGTRGVPLGAYGDSIDLMFYDSHDQVAGIVRESTRDHGSRQLFAASDSFVRQASTAISPKLLAIAPPYALSRLRIAIGDGMSYQIAIFDQAGTQRYRFGRALPPDRRGPRSLALASDQYRTGSLVPGPGGQMALPPSAQARLDTIDREIVPHFGTQALHFDDEGRLWVIGTIGDSTFADVFADSMYLGRHLLPCFRPARGIALTGKWLLLRCDRSDLGEPAFALQLYRIADPADSARATGSTH